MGAFLIPPVLPVVRDFVFFLKSWNVGRVMVVSPPSSVFLPNLFLFLVFNNHFITVIVQKNMSGMSSIFQPHR